VKQRLCAVTCKLQYLLFTSMETTDTKSTITLFDRTNSKLQKKIFFNIAITINHAFLPAMNQSLHTTLVKICTSGGDPVFHSCNDGIIAKKTLPTAWMKVRTHPLTPSDTEMPHAKGVTVRTISMHSCVTL